VRRKGLFPEKSPDRLVQAGEKLYSGDRLATPGEHSLEVSRSIFHKEGVLCLYCKHCWKV